MLKGFCVQVVSYESILNCLVRLQAVQQLSVHADGMLDTVNTMSYEKFVVDLEVLEMVKYFLAGMTINEENMAMDVVNKVVPGSEFLTHKHTLKHFRTEPFLPQISLRRATGNPHEMELDRINQVKSLCWRLTVGMRYHPHWKPDFMNIC